jgi:hypothetical protein
MSVSSISIAPSSVTSKGGLIFHNGSGPYELPVGSDGQVLSATSTATAGAMWVNAAFGSAGYILIASGSVTAGTTEINLTSITGSYKNLHGYIYGSVESVATEVELSVQINSDTTTSYISIHLNVRTNSTVGDVERYGDSIEIFGALQGTSNYVSGVSSLTQFNIMDYSSATKYKSITSRQNQYSAWTGATALRFSATDAIWVSSSAITALRLFIKSGSFRSGTTYALYASA